MKRLMVVGACYIDTILSVSHYPQEDEKLRATEMTRRRGGNGPNTLEVLSQLVQHEPAETSVDLLLCSVLPMKNSASVTFIESSFNGHLDLEHCIYRENESEAASSFIVKSSGTGSRTIVNYNALKEMTYDEFLDIAGSIKPPVDWFHFEGRIPDVTLTCVRHIRERYPSATVSIEVEKPGREGLRELAAVADVVFYSRSWAQHEGYVSSRECLVAEADQASTANLICSTWGESGATVMQLPDRQIYSCPAYQPNGFELIDSTGAGDTFIAGVLFGLLCRQRWTYEQKLRFALMLAGKKVSQEAFAGLETVLREYEAEAY